MLEGREKVRICIYSRLVSSWCCFSSKCISASLVDYYILSFQKYE